MFLEILEIMFKHSNALSSWLSEKVHRKLKSPYKNPGLQGLKTGKAFVNSTGETLPGMSSVSSLLTTVVVDKVIFKLQINIKWQT